MGTVAVIGTFDSKGEEFRYLIEQIQKAGAQVLSIDIGTKGPAMFQPDISAEEVARAAGEDLAELRKTNDPARCMQTEAAGLPVLVKELQGTGRIQAVIAMGGGQGSSVLRRAFAVLPAGFPKVLVTTMAGAGNKLLGGIKDTLLIDSVVDFSGLNDIIAPIIRNAGAAAAAMSCLPAWNSTRKKRIAATMFGITTPCVEQCRQILTAEGYDFYPFHANGMGGPAMESLIAEGAFDLVLDITTTELLQDMVVPGTGCVARLEAAGKAGVPQIVCPGAMDSTNIFFTDVARFPGRRMHRHNAEVFLMRARPEDEVAVGGLLAEKLNRAAGPVRVVVPMGGFSKLSRWLPDPEADQALLDTLKRELKPEIALTESKAEINSPEFARLLCEQVRQMLPL